MSRIVVAWLLGIGQHIRCKHELCNAGDHRVCWDAPPGIREARRAA